MNTNDLAKPQASTADANFRWLVMDIIWFGLAVPATARFLSVYAIRLDASPMMLGWLTALPSLIALVTSSLAGWWSARHRDIIHAQFWPGLTYRLIFLLPALTPFFPEEWQTTWLVLAVALPAIPQGIASVLFLVILRRAVDMPQLTALMSRRSMVFNIAVAGMTLVFGLWLEEMPFPLNYQIMFVAAFAFSLGSLFSVQQVRPLAPEPIAPPEQAAMSPWRSPLFRRMAIVTVIVHVAFFFISAIIPLRLVDGLGADEGFMSLYALAELGAAAAGAAFANRIVQRLGNQLVISLGLAITGAAALLLALAPSLPWTLVAGAVSGAAWTAAAISLFGYFSENTPAESLTRFSTVYNQIVLLSVFVGPMLGSQLASSALDVDAVMLVGAVLRLAAGVALALIALGSVQRLARRRLALRGES